MLFLSYTLVLRNYRQRQLANSWKNSMMLQTIIFGKTHQIDRSDMDRTGPLAALIFVRPPICSSVRSFIGSFICLFLAILAIQPFVRPDYIDLSWLNTDSSTFQDWNIWWGIIKNIVYHLMPQSWYQIDSPVIDEHVVIIFVTQSVNQRNSINCLRDP